MSLLDPQAINAFFTHPIFTSAVGISAVIAVLIYTLGFSGVIRKELKRRRMKSRIDHLKDHYILCGFGRVGQQVAKELAAEGELFVVIERDEAKAESAKEHNWAYLVGDVAVDETLFEKARIQTAKAVIIAVGSDADAIFMAISARALRDDIFIVARASSLEAADKLNKINVNRIALPYQIGGYHMATMALRPTVVDFLDLLVDHQNDELEMEEYLVNESGHYIGKTLKEAGFTEDNVAVLAIRKKNGKAVINPIDTTKLESGDRLVVMGPEDKLGKLTTEFEKHQTTSKGKKEDEAPAEVVKPSPFLDQQD